MRPNVQHLKGMQPKDKIWDILQIKVREIKKYYAI